MNLVCKVRSYGAGGEGIRRMLRRVPLAGKCADLGFASKRVTPYLTMRAKSLFNFLSLRSHGKQ